MKHLVPDELLTDSRASYNKAAVSGRESVHNLTNLSRAIPTMTPDDIRKILDEHRQELQREHGVASLELFGSVARGTAIQTSDVDLLVEFDDRPVGLLHLIGTAQYLEKLLGAPVDLVLRRAVIPELRDEILGEAIDVFRGEKLEIPHSPHARGH